MPTTNSRLAGGFGNYAAHQDEESLLRRCVLANLLWEDSFYVNGESVVDKIKGLIPQVNPQIVADLAFEARTKQKLRHIPLLLVREMCRYPSHKNLVGSLLPRIIQRADEITEFVSLYWKDGKEPLSKQAKVGLAEAFTKFDEYHFAKYDRDTVVKFRDVLKMIHGKPPLGKEGLYHRIITRTLATPDTWEVALSRGDNKKDTWERLIIDGKLGALAFLRNLRNMSQVGVDRDIIREGLLLLNPSRLLPINFLVAVKESPQWVKELDLLMLKGLQSTSKLPGHTILVVDVSGSMAGSISSKSTLSRFDAACALAIIASETTESVSIYATAGDDLRRVGKTEFIPLVRGFELQSRIVSAADSLGGGGIFTRQALEYIRGVERSTPDRIIVFSDSQDCDYPDRRLPSPFGKKNYICDVSSHVHGINYQGIWTAEISGWSEHFLDYIRGIEGII